MNIGRFSIIVIIIRLLGASIARAQTTDRHPVPGTYETTWLGNSIADGTTHVPGCINTIFATADGRVLTNCVYDEGGGEVSEFDAGGRLIASADHTHGWGYAGGVCITANSKFVFFGQRVDNEGGHLVDAQTWPAKGKIWYGVSRRLLPDIRRGAPFSGGKGGGGDTVKGSFLEVGELDTPSRADAFTPREPRVTAIAATDERLFVADGFRSRICVYDANTLALIAEVPNWPRITAMALDPAGDLWIAQSAGDGMPAMVSSLDISLHLNSAKIELADGVEPVGLAIDSAGRVIIADGGRAANIVTFDPRQISGNPAQPSHTFGTNLFAGTGPMVGRIGPGRFPDITGVAVDRDGDLYVSSSAPGAVLEKYDIHEQRLWVRYGLTFIDDASIDPLTGDIYGSNEHYGFDWSSTKPGSEWSYLGKTLDRNRFPDDVRIEHERQPLMQRLNGGRLYAFASDQGASGIYVYRFDPEITGEVAIPCACITKGRLASHPTLGTGQFIWCDTNGDGRFDLSEISHPPLDGGDLHDNCWGWWVDEKGDIWQTVNGEGAERGIRHYPLMGFDTRGSPIYRFDTMKATPIPAPFLHRWNNGLERIVYDSNSDVMYLGGYTEAAQSDDMWGAFRAAARYDHWMAGNRKPSWVIELPWAHKQPGHTFDMPIGMTVAGDYLFTDGTQTCCRVSVYRKSDGAYVGDMIPNNGIFTVDQTGWVDIRPFGIQASLRPDGSYCVLVEDVLFAKTIIYRWNP